MIRAKQNGRCFPRLGGATKSVLKGKTTISVEREDYCKVEQESIASHCHFHTVDMHVAVSWAGTMFELITHLHHVQHMSMLHPLGNWEVLCHFRPLIHAFHKIHCRLSAHTLREYAVQCERFVFVTSSARSSPSPLLCSSSSEKVTRKV
jgi:hypothetical protein